MQYGHNPTEAVDRARQSAERSLELDFLDPFANYCMARVDWLAGNLESSLNWLDRSLEISPNFAQAHYLQGLMHALSGGSEKARTANVTAMALSPLDPLYYAMLATHAMSYINEENFNAAYAWAERAAHAPGAHHLAVATAAVANELAGRTDRAQFWIADVLRRRPDVTANAFFHSFPFADTPARKQIACALQRLGIQ